MMKLNYYKPLDSLRFFSVFAVMIAHWIQWKWQNPILTKIPFVHGVTVFFVLSGYLITRILLEVKEENKLHGEKWHYSLKQFYIRRFLRIFPIYYLLIFSLFIIDYQNTKEILPWLVTYTSNIYQSIYNIFIGDFSHFWSLAVEEQFYLFWPILIFLVKQKRLLHLILACIAFSLLTRTYLFFFVGKWMATAYSTPSCMNSLGIGALLAYISIYEKQVMNRISNFSILLVVLLVYITQFVVRVQYKLDWMYEIFDDFLFSILIAIIISRILTNKLSSLSKKFLENKCFIYAGKISYGLYIFHMFIHNFFRYLSGKIGWNSPNMYWDFIIFFGLTILVAHISWITIEKPLLRIKSKFNYLASK